MKFGSNLLNNVMKLFTNRAAAQALDVPTSSWGWHKRKGSIPNGAFQAGERRFYTEEQLVEIAALLRSADYSRGKRGRKPNDE